MPPTDDSSSGNFAVTELPYGLQPKFAQHSGSQGLLDWQAEGTVGDRSFVVFPTPGVCPAGAHKARG